MEKNYPNAIFGKYSAILFFLFALLLTNSTFAQFPGNDNTPGGPKVFNVPANVTHVNVAAWGAGGGGGGSSVNGSGGNGGGGGGAASGQIAVSSGNTFTYTITAGGTAGASGGGTGGNGGNTTITSVSPLINFTANGGKGGLGNAAALNTPTNSSGGTATGGTINSSGLDGTQNAANGGSGGNSGTAFSIFGIGPAGAANSTGATGGQPGAGGSGGERNGGTNTAGGAGAPGRVMFDYITVSSVAPSPVCVGSTITITGTNFSGSGSTTVSVNGTPCTSVTFVNATTITAIIAAGTTSGVVDISNNGRRNNGKSITVNSAPANPGNPTSNSPQCITPGVTLTRTGTPPAGETWYWQTTSLGTSTANSGSTYIATTSGTYYIRSQNNTTGCWSTGEGSISVIVNNPPTITTNPTNSSIAVGTNTSFTVVASNSPTSYVWEVSTNGGGSWSTVVDGGVYSNATTATLNITGATLSMNGYMYRAKAVNSCGTSTASTSATLTVSLVYCTPSSTSTTTYPISNVTFAGINNSSSAATSAGPFYQDFSAISGNVIPNGTYTFSATATGVSPNPFGIYVFFDWNNNGDLSDDGGPTTIGTYTTTASGVLSTNIIIPSTAVVGTSIRMRVSNQYNVIPGPCPSGVGSFQDEDYTLNIIAGPACTTPTAQPTALVLTPAGTSISGSFTAASPAPNNYLVIINTTGVAPTPTNGTTYNVGDNLGGTNVVVDTDNNTTFTAGQLNLSTLYYIYVFSMNNACSGGPLYRTVSPLNGSTTTTSTPPTYCTPVTTSTPINTLYISSVAFVGTLLDTNNTSTTDATPDGYQDFTGLTKSIQAQGGPINMKVTSDTGRGFWKVWVDWNKDGDFLDSGEEIYNPGGYLFASTTFGFIVPSNTAPGNYRMRLRVQNSYDYANPTPNEVSVAFDSCNTFSSNASYKTYGEAEDYLFTVIPKCDNIITGYTNPAICGTGTAAISATCTTGAQVKWWDSLTGGTQLGITASGATFTTPSIAATTTFYAEAFNASCTTLVRTPITVVVKPVPGLNIANPNPTVCGENTIIQLDATGNNETAYLIDENFEGGTLGVFSNINSDATTAAQKGQTAWKNKTSIFVPNGGRWFPAIQSNFGANKFVLTSMDDFKTVPLPTVNMENSLTLTNSLNPTLTGFTNLTLSLRLFYSRYYDDGVNPTLENCKIEYSTNGGGAWTTLTGGNITADQGYGSNFVTLTYAMPAACVTSTALKIRIKVLGNGSASGTAGDGAAVDDVKLYGDRPLTPFFALGGGVNAYTDALATIPYTGDQRNTIWVKPTLTQLESASFTINVTANLNNGCTTSSPINVTNNSKVWKGTINSDWNNSGNWGPNGIPTSNSCVIIPTGTTSQITNTPNALAKNVTIKAPTGNLELQASQNLTVTDWVNVESGATFNVRNSANLVQVNDAAVNTGSINMNRIASGLHAKDYIYWSSPVENFGVANVSPLTSTSRIYHWVPDYFNGAGYGYGNWFNVNENMTPGKGYIIRVPNSNPTYTATFTGKPQNGVITRTIVRGPYTGANYVGTNGVTITNEDDNWNLVGNPYPSAIDAVEFLTANNTSIAGQVNLWTHSTPISISSSPYYQTFVYNYKSNDYVTYNSAGSNIGPTVGFNGKIGAGQAFFVKRLDGAAGSGTITFNNGMRTDATNNPYNNGQFYKTSGDETAPAEPEKHRIWLDLIDSSLNTSRVMFGYVEGATNAKDHMFDATTNYTESLKAFTNIDKEEEIYVIQAKGLPFNTSDKISYGIQVPASGSYSIAISDVDGLFKTENQKIYIEDLLTNTTHDLTSSPYSFNADAGISKNRFVIKFDNQTLSNNDNAYANSVTVFGQQQLTVKSELFNIKNIVVYDLLGKTLLNVKDANTKEYTLANLRNTNSALLVKTTLENGAVITKKVIF